MKKTKKYPMKRLPKSKIKRESQSWRRAVTAETPRPRFFEKMIVKAGG